VEQTANHTRSVNCERAREEHMSTAISACIVALDEEKTIGECIESLKPFADEIVVVVDSRSSDRTVQVCEEHGARVVHRDWMGFVGQKDFSVDTAENDWVFCIDADERVSPELAQRIQTMKRKGFMADAYEVNRRNFYLGRWMRYGGWYPDRKVRLFDRRKARWGGADLHERVLLDREARSERLGLDLIHFPYRDITHHVQVINNYASIAAREKEDRGARFVTFHLVVNPVAKFFKAYVLRGGFLAGMRGMIHAVMASYSVFLKYAKLWESQRRNRTDRTP